MHATYTCLPCRLSAVNVLIVHSQESVKGDIKLSGIEFAYPSRPGVQVLRGLDINIYAGQMVALVGQSGCGKSTIISLLELFYKPANGELVR